MNQISDPTKVPGWDYRKCRCENNGDYCEYCEDTLHDYNEDESNFEPDPMRLAKEEF